MKNNVLYIIIAYISSLFMAFSNGANDVANAFATAVGAKTINAKNALFLAAFFNFLGAILLGYNVVLTMIDNLIPLKMVSNPSLYIFGMTISLISSSIFIFLSTLLGLPVSSTHSAVGSLTGISIVLLGFKSIQWKTLLLISLAWIISPIFAGSLSFFASIFINAKNKNNFNNIKYYLSISISLLLSILFIFFYKNIVCKLFLFFPIWIFLFIFINVIFSTFLNNKKNLEFFLHKVHICTACYISFAHGSNDVSNSIAPLFAISMAIGKNFLLYQNNNNTMYVPFYMLLFGGGGMSLGIFVLGHKVITTLGSNITKLNLIKGLSADLSTSTSVTLSTLLGVPVSTTHAATGSIIGIGLYETFFNNDLKNNLLNFKILKRIILTWLITVPTSSLLTIIIYKIIFYIFYSFP